MTGDPTTTAALCCRERPEGGLDGPCTWPETDCYQNGPAMPTTTAACEACGKAGCAGSCLGDLADVATHDPRPACGDCTVEGNGPCRAGCRPTTTAATERYGVPDDPETTEHLRTQLIAITEAERKALNDAACYIAASSHLPGVQGLAGAVLNVANRGGVNAD